MKRPRLTPMLRDLKAVLLAAEMHANRMPPERAAKLNAAIERHRRAGQVMLGMAKSLQRTK